MVIFELMGCGLAESIPFSVSSGTEKTPAFYQSRLVRYTVRGVIDSLRNVGSDCVTFAAVLLGRKGVKFVVSVWRLISIPDNAGSPARSSSQVDCCRFVYLARQPRSLRSVVVLSCLLADSSNHFFAIEAGTILYGQKVSGCNSLRCSRCFDSFHDTGFSAGDRSLGGLGNDGSRSRAVIEHCLSLLAGGANGRVARDRHQNTRFALGAYGASYADSPRQCHCGYVPVPSSSGQRGNADVASPGRSELRNKRQPEAEFGLEGQSHGSHDRESVPPGCGEERADPFGNAVSRLRRVCTVSDCLLHGVFRLAYAVRVLASGDDMLCLGDVVNEVLRIEDLSFSYPDGVEALRGISLSISAGEKVAFVGANGAGKSTLLLHLNGILAGEGNVYVCSQRVCRKSLNTVRAAVGLVFQDPDDQLFSPTVWEDVAFGPLYMGLAKQEVEARARMALELVGMQEMAHRPPHNMSLGEKKRAAMATVLAMKPEILALDEPTSALDARSRQRIIGILKELPQTVIIATHDMALVAQVAGRTVVIDRGEVVADRLTEEIVGERNFLEEHGLEMPGLSVSQR